MSNNPKSTNQPSLTAESQLNNIVAQKPSFEINTPVSYLENIKFDGLNFDQLRESNQEIITVINKLIIQLKAYDAVRQKYLKALENKIDEDTYCEEYEIDTDANILSVMEGEKDARPILAKVRNEETSNNLNQNSQSEVDNSTEEPKKKSKKKVEANQVNAEETTKKSKKEATEVSSSEEPKKKKATSVASEEPKKKATSVASEEPKKKATSVASEEPKKKATSVASEEPKKKATSVASEEPKKKITKKKIETVETVVELEQDNNRIVKNNVVSSEDKEPKKKKKAIVDAVTSQEQLVVPVLNNTPAQIPVPVSTNTVSDEPKKRITKKKVVS